MSENSWISYSDDEGDDPNKNFRPRYNDSDDDTPPPDSESEDGANSEEEDVYKAEAARLAAKRPRQTDEQRQAKRRKVQKQEQRDEKDSKKTGQQISSTTASAFRVLIPNPATTVDTIIFISHPQYTTFPKTASGLEPGGSSMTCILGPAAVLSTNSNAQSTASLPCLQYIVPAHQNHSWYAGHLLNAQFRGPSTTNNMTALTGSANHQQTGFDNHIVNAVGHLKAVYTKLNNVGVDIMSLGYGIHLNIVVNVAKWGTNSPDDCISTGLTCTATVVTPPNVDALVGAIYPNAASLPAFWNLTRQEILDLIDMVQAEVNTANSNGNVTNT